jgi:hypothetical protein
LFFNERNECLFFGCLIYLRLQFATWGKWWLRIRVPFCFVGSWEASLCLGLLIFFSNKR